jgi:hypothetical protein
MKVKQISVFLENKTGRLAEVTDVLGKGGINLRAITIADTADFGILRFVASDPNKALSLLESKGFTAKETDVLGIEVPDRPGGLSAVMAALGKNNVNIEYLYASLEKNKDRAVVVFKIEDIDRGLEVLKESGFTTISAW